MDNNTFAYRRLLLSGLVTAMFMASLESTIASVAMPVAVKDLFGKELYIWPITGYMLASTISGPAWGRLADVKGLKKVYILGVAVFVVGSLLSGLSWNMLSLTLFRVLQGIGGGALFVLTFTVIGATFSLKERGRVTSYTSSVWAVGSLLGPLLGGLIVEVVGWRWVFLINIPPGMLSIYLIHRYLLVDFKGSERSMSLSGLTSFTLAAAAALVMIDSGLLYDGRITLYLLPLVAISVALFLHHELRSEDPFIPRKIIRSRYNASLMLLNSLSGFVFFGSIATMPPILQWVVGLPPTDVGLILSSLTLCWVAANNVGSRLVVKFKAERLLVTGSILLLSSMVLFSLLGNFGHGIAAYITGLALLGGGMGLAVPVSLIVAQTLSDKGELGAITSFLAFVRTFGGAIGAQVMWAPLSRIIASGQVLEVAQLPLYASFGIGVVLTALMLALTAYVKFPNLLEIERSRRGDELDQFGKLER